MKTSGYSRDILLILAASFFYNCSTVMVTPLIAGFTESLGAGAALMGFIGGAMSICSLLCRPVVGNLTDRISKYHLAFAGAIAIIVACVGYVVSVSPVMVMAFRILHGLGFACCSVCLSTWMSDLLPREKVGSGMGLYGTMNALGMAVAPAVGVNVCDALGYRVTFAIAVACGVMTLITIQFVKDRDEPDPAAAGRGRGLAVIEPKAAPVAVIMMLFTIPYYATQSFLVTYTQARGIVVTVGMFFPVYAVVLLALRLSLRSLFDRKPFRFFLLVCSASALVGICSLWAMRGNGLMFLAAAGMAGGFGVMCSVSQSTSILMAGPGKRGLANSTYYVGIDLGMALGPILGGVLYGNLDLSLFYPVLAVTVPLGLAVYAVTRKVFQRETAAPAG